MSLNNKTKQNRILTAIVGSYPKPRYILSYSARELLDDVGIGFYELQKKIGPKEFKKRLDKATLMAIEDQNSAGIDLITDGEERRDHYILYVLKKLKGFDCKHLEQKLIRQNHYLRKLPIVKKKISYQKPILVNDYKFTARYASGIAKIGLPGPLTVVDSVMNRYYRGDQKQMALDYARAIRQEVKALIQAGCQVIQFDDSLLMRYPEPAKKWGIKALEMCFQGLENKATFIVHICCGYPDKALEEKKISYKANKDYYQEILSWLKNSAIDVISIEGAQTNLDLSILPAAGKKTVMLGVLDVGSNKIETIKSLVTRGREALKYLPKKQLILAPDCGMLQLSRQAARKKLINLAKAASILNENGKAKPCHFFIYF